MPHQSSVQIYHHPSQHHPHTHPMKLNNSNITRPSTPPQIPRIIWNSETKQAVPLSNFPITKHCSQTCDHSPIKDHPPTLVASFQDLPQSILAPFQDHFQQMSYVLNGTLPPKPAAPSTRESTISSPTSSPTSKSTSSTESDYDKSTSNQSTVSRLGLETTTPSQQCESMSNVSWYGLNNLTHSSLSHAIEHGVVKGSHMAFNVQHKINLIYTKGEPCGMVGNIGLSPG